MALLVNPTNPDLAEADARDLHIAAHKLGLRLHVLRASIEREIDEAFATAVQLRVSALLIGNDALFSARNEQIAALSNNQYAVPTNSPTREFTVRGGLMSYGGDNADAIRLSGIYVGRILKGEKPSELPVDQSVKVQLVINLKTARALGLTIPLPLLARADEVIE